MSRKKKRGELYREAPDLERQEKGKYFLSNFRGKKEPIDETSGPQTTNSMDPVHYLKMMVKAQIDEAWAKHVKEAEHLDGESFWANFANPKEAFVDFVRTLAQTTLPELQQQEEQTPTPVEQNPNQEFIVDYFDNEGVECQCIVEAPTVAHARVEFQRMYKGNKGIKSIRRHKQ